MFRGFQVTHDQMGDVFLLYTFMILHCSNIEKIKDDNTTGPVSSKLTKGCRGPPAEVTAVLSPISFHEFLSRNNTSGEFNHTIYSWGCCTHFNLVFDINHDVLLTEMRQFFLLTKSAIDNTCASKAAHRKNRTGLKCRK